MKPGCVLSPMLVAVADKTIKKGTIKTLKNRKEINVYWQYRRH